MTLIADTRKIILSQTVTTPGTMVISWDIPADAGTIDGLLISMANKPYDSSMSPSQGQRYLAGVDLTSFAASRLGDAFVVYSSNKIIGQTLPLKGSVTITNVDPLEEWHVFAFGVSNTFEYSMSPIYGYILVENDGNSVPTTFPGSIPTAELPPATPTLGETYYNLTTGHVQMWTGSVWINASTKPIETGNADQYPTATSVPPLVAGDFYYDTTVRKLFIYDGTFWKRADTAEQDSPMVEKIGIGTDGSYDERARLIDILKIQLGYPAICVELSESAYNVAIDNALDEFRRRADNAYNMQYVIFELKPGQVKYYLNDPRIGSNRVVNVIKIHRVNSMGMNSITGEMSVYAQAFFQQMYTGGGFDILSIHMMACLAEEYQRIFAGDLSFVWNESTRQLQILRQITRPEKVILECSMERTDQDLLTDRWAKQWLQHWAHSEAVEQLGFIRSKFGNLPGAGGGVTLNGSELFGISSEMQVEALRQISDYEVGNGGTQFGNCSFVMG
jgi:hypothetical protein